MKATEVRIGNYVEVEGDYARLKTLVMGMANKGLRIEYAGLAPKNGRVKVYPYDQCMPISLTQDWLEAFDFIADNGSWSHAGLILTEKNGEFSVDLNHRNLSILHVHQLQNLYYALFNEELKLNHGAIF